MLGFCNPNLVKILGNPPTGLHFEPNGWVSPYLTHIRVGKTLHFLVYFHQESEMRIWWTLSHEAMGPECSSCVWKRQCLIRQWLCR